LANIRAKLQTAADELLESNVPWTPAATMNSLTNYFGFLFKKNKSRTKSATVIVEGFVDIKPQIEC